MKLGRAIKIARVRKSWSQSELAARLSVTPTYISQLERDQRDPSWSFVNKLADTVGVPLPLLLLLAMEGDEKSSKATPLQSVLAHELLSLVARKP